MRDTTIPGTAAESAATRFLLDRGYRIVERNFRCRAGELDIIARDGPTLVFVEVRSRTDAAHGHAAEMVNPRKRRRVARAAACYLEIRRPEYSDARFDVVASTAGVLELIKDAWRG